MAKKAFDLSRNSIYVADPMQLCVIGALAIWPDAVIGEHDTHHKEGEHELWDSTLHETPTEAEVRNVDAYGVIEPIVIAKLDDVPTVVDGRQRVHRARLANIARKARGEPPISIECKVARLKAGRLDELMIAANEVRRKEEAPAARLAKLQRLLARGVSIEDAAVVFGLGAQTLKGWLSFADRAVPELRKAVESGVVSMSAAVTIARRPATEQAEALAKAPTPTARAARSAVSPRPGRKLVQLVVEAAAERASRDDPYWLGVASALQWAGTGLQPYSSKLDKLVERLTEKAP